MPPPEAWRIAAAFGFRGRMGRLAFLGWYALLAIYTLILFLVAVGPARLTRGSFVVVLAAAPLAWAALTFKWNACTTWTCQAATRSGSGA